MDADLVGAPGLDGHVQQAHRLCAALRAARPHLDQGDRGHAVGVLATDHLDAALAVGLARLTVYYILVQGLVQHLFISRPVAQHQGQVGFAGLALAKLLLQIFKGAALFGDQQDAAGFAVQPVHQLQKGRAGARHAQLLDDPKTHARAAMHGHPGGFVQRQKSLVLVQNRKSPGRRTTRRLLGHGHGLVLGALGHAHRRQAQHVAGLHAGVGAGTALVDAHFAAANDPVNMGFRHAFEMAHQKIVQPLVGLFCVHSEPLRRGGQGRCRRVGGGRGQGPYNVLH